VRRRCAPQNENACGFAAQNENENEDEVEGEVEGEVEVGIENQTENSQLAAQPRKLPTQN